MNRRIYGEDADHPKIAVSLHELGSILQDKGDLDGAESQYRASLSMKRRIYGEDADHPGISASLHQLGLVLQKKEHGWRNWCRIQ